MSILINSSNSARRYSKARRMAGRSLRPLRKTGYARWCSSAAALPYSRGFPAGRFAILPEIAVPEVTHPDVPRVDSKKISVDRHVSLAYPERLRNVSIDADLLTVDSRNIWMSN